MAFSWVGTQTGPIGILGKKKTHKCKIKLLKRFVETPYYWLHAASKDMVLIVGKLPIKSTQVVAVKSSVLDVA